jgi:hypothetical protein
VSGGFYPVHSWLRKHLLKRSLTVRDPMFGGEQRMNHWRRKILLGALAGVVVTMLFPPFDVHPGGNKVYLTGFHFIFSWPGGTDYGIVDIPLLLTEWFAIAIVCGILWMLTRDAKTPRVIDLALRFIETNAAAKIEAAKITAEATIEAAEVKSQRGD